MAFDDQFLHELKGRIDISNYISSYMNLSGRQGRTQKGLCPFHNEKTPSFVVYDDTQSFYCFGCGAGGDIISFIMKSENLDYVEAVKYLADKAGMSMPEDGFDDSVYKKKKRILEANKESARFFYQQLFEKKNKFALDYYINRGFSLNTIKRFGLGYAPDSWDSLRKHLTSKGFSSEELFQADLLKKSNKNNSVRYYDNFRHRMMTPIIDIRGNVVGFGGRVLDDSKPKYINTSDTLVYKKSKEVFALNFAKSANSKNFIVAEGYMDVISLHQAGFENSVACLGTALTREQAMLIKKYADDVTLAYDSDEAGQKATKRAIDIFSSAGLNIKVLQLRGGKDPDDIIKKFGAERFKSLILEAENDIEYAILKIREKYDVTSADGKGRFLNEVALVLSDVANPIQRDTYAGKLAEETVVSKDAILTQINYLIKKKKKKEERQYFDKINDLAIGKDDKVNPERKNQMRAAIAEEKLIINLLSNLDFYKNIKNLISPDDFATHFNRRVYSEVINRIENGQEVGIGCFNEKFNIDEVGKITEYFVNEKTVSNTLKECEDCIKVIKEEKSKFNLKSVENLSDEDFLKMFKEKQINNT